MITVHLPNGPSPHLAGRREPQIAGGPPLPGMEMLLCGTAESRGAAGAGIAGATADKVHLPNVRARDGIPHRSLIAPVRPGASGGFGPNSERLGPDAARPATAGQAQRSEISRH